MILTGKKIIDDVYSRNKEVECVIEPNGSLKFISYVRKYIQF